MLKWPNISDEKIGSIKLDFCVQIYSHPKLSKKAYNVLSISFWTERSSSHFYFCSLVPFERSLLTMQRNTSKEKEGYYFVVVHLTRGMKVFKHQLS